MLLLFSIYLIVTILGPLTHFAFWSVGAWDGIFWFIALCNLFAHKLLVAIISFLHASTQDGAYLLATYVSTSITLLHLEILYTLSILASVTIYRAFFHPLRSFPSPRLATISVWWRVYHTLRSGDRHAIFLDSLHKQYGDIVRVGPNVLSIRSASAVEMIHGEG